MRRRVDVRIAADESIRRAEDPLEVAVSGAADIAVVKVAPLGGVRRALRVAQACGLPVVVSSAVETSVGLAAGLALAGALPVPRQAPAPDPLLLKEFAADEETTKRWLYRLRRCGG